MEKFSAVELSLIYSAISFSIVFLVLGLLTAIIYAVRFVAGEEPKTPAPPVEKAAPVFAPAPAAPAPAPASGGARHVAAIAAAILAATQGRGKVLSVAPEGTVAFCPGTTRMWRAAAVVEAASRRLRRSWSR
ncbi:MAG: OadG family protein [Synergistaceae bacterium]|jgi:sodium pump decarboxylase gamma subunit|nr:OadG family protein [Synergistaceae bacterium]